MCGCWFTYQRNIWGHHRPVVVSSLLALDTHFPSEKRSDKNLTSTLFSGLRPRSLTELARQQYCVWNGGRVCCAGVWVWCGCAMCGSGVGSVWSVLCCAVLPMCVCLESVYCVVLCFAVCLSCCRVVVWRVTWFGTLKNPPFVNSTRLRVYIQNVSVYAGNTYWNTCAGVAAVDGDVLNVHTKRVEFTHGWRQIERCRRRRTYTYTCTCVHTYTCRYQ